MSEHIPGAAIDELTRERDEARREAAELALQLKHLVKAEHALTRTRRELESQLARIHRLAALGLEIAGLDDDEAILAVAANALEDLFSLASVRIARGRLVDETEPCVEPANGQKASIALRATEGRAEPSQLVVVVPLRPRGGTGATLVGIEPPVRQQLDAPRPEHVAFLRLFAAHVVRALEAATLTAALRREQEALSRTNQKLHDSLVALERTQLELVQAQKLDAIGRLAGGIAHDFNNLLTIIMANTESLRAVVGSVGERADDLDSIADAANRAATMTKRLLQFGRRQETAPSEIEVGDIVSNLVHLMRPLIGSNISLRVVGAATRGRVRCDPMHLEQILMNLVVNARDAMPNGGAITIEATYSAHDRISLAVIDEGVGIDEATRLRLFEPFFTTKAPGSGTGLGLATAYGLAKLNKGEITVESAPNRGARFTVVLPSTVLPESRLEQASSSMGVRRVLLVDDEEVIRRTCARVLEANGYQVTEAANGAEALAILDEGERFDALLTDVMMPVIGGAELAPRAIEQLPDIRVIFMSGYTFDRLRSADLDERGATFLAKPFTSRQLLDAMGQAVGVAGQVRSQIQSSKGS
jgi:signal transduction histidine kinase/ActR/RegA family two-component response regulator